MYLEAIKAKDGWLIKIVKYKEVRTRVNVLRFIRDNRFKNVDFTSEEKRITAEK